MTWKKSPKPWSNRETFTLRSIRWSTSKGGARLIEGRHEKPDFWDVALRPDDWDDNNGTCYGEWEDLTRPEAEKKVAELESQHPGIAVNWVNDDA
jgi:hypothetical protein